MGRLGVESHIRIQFLPHRVISPFFLMFGCEAAAKHMLLADESTKYVGDSEGILNLKLMQQLYHVVAYNLAKSRTARDGNRILKRKNFKLKHLKLNGLVLVRDHTSKAFEPKAIDHHIVDFCGKNQVLVKDNYGNKKKVHVKDVKPIEMDIATAEFFRKEREQCTTRDAKHVNQAHTRFRVGIHREHQCNGI